MWPCSIWIQVVDSLELNFIQDKISLFLLRSKISRMQEVFSLVGRVMPVALLIIFIAPFYNPSGLYLWCWNHHHHHSGSFISIKNLTALHCLALCEGQCKPYSLQENIFYINHQQWLINVLPGSKIPGFCLPCCWWLCEESASVLPPAHFITWRDLLILADWRNMILDFFFFDVQTPPQISFVFIRGWC